MTVSKCSYMMIIVTYILMSYPVVIGANEEILVGATISLEGRFQAPSKMMKLSYRLWEKEVNKNGGILGRPVRLIFYDDKSKKELVRVYYEKMILEDKVDLVLAPYGTTLSYEASSVTERHGYILIACAASGEMIWNRGYQYVFGVYGLAKRYFIGFLDIIAQNGFRSVAIVSEDTLFTRDAAEGAGIWARRLGIDVQLQQVYKDGAEFFPVLARRLKDLKPDAVILCSYPPDGYQFLKVLSVSSFRPKALAMSITPGLPDFSDKAGAISEGIFGPSQWEPDGRLPFPGTIDFIEKFIQFAGVNPSYHAGAAYAGCQLLQKSITTLGALHHKKIRDYIARLDTVTVIGRFKVDPYGRQIGHNTIIIQWQNKKKEIVYPRKIKTRKARFAKPYVLKNNK